MKFAGRLPISFCFLLAIVFPIRADVIEDGRAAFAKRDYPSAADAFKSALSSQGPSAGLYYNLAMAQQKSGERAQAACEPAPSDHARPSHDRCAHGSLGD